MQQLLNTTPPCRHAAGALRQAAAGMLLGTLLIFHLAAAAAHGQDAPTSTSMEIAGQLKEPYLKGISGLVASRKQPGVLWIHNDFAKERYLYAISRKARLLATFRLQGVESINWEDIALGPGPQPGTEYLYIGDIGDNLHRRPGITVYRLPEPAVRPDQEPAAIPLDGAEALRFNYPEGARYDAEALLVDPRSGDLFIITKELGLSARIFRSRAPQTPGKQRTLEPEGTVQTGICVTAGDISPRGDRIILRTYFQALLWPRAAGDSVAQALAAAAQPMTIIAEPQGEAVGFDASGQGFYTLSESEHPGLFHYAVAAMRKRPAATSAPGKQLRQGRTQP